MSHTVSLLHSHTSVDSSYPPSCCTGESAARRCSSNLVNISDPFPTGHGSSGSALPQVQDAGSIGASSSAGKTLPNIGTSTPTTIKDGNILFECTVCKRQVRSIYTTSPSCPNIHCRFKIASNRYAPHLSSCMGIGTGVRRGAARATNLKSKYDVNEITLCWRTNLFQDPDRPRAVGIPVSWLGEW